MNDGIGNIILSVVIGILSYIGRCRLNKTKEKVKEVKASVIQARGEIREVKEQITVVIQNGGHYEELLREIIAIKSELNNRSELSNEQLRINAELYSKIIRYEGLFSKFFQIVKSQNKQLQDLYRNK